MTGMKWVLTPTISPANYSGHAEWVKETSFGLNKIKSVDRFEYIAHLLIDSDLGNQVSAFAAASSTQPDNIQFPSCMLVGGGCMAQIEAFQWGCMQHVARRPCMTFD